MNWPAIIASVLGAVSTIIGGVLIYLGKRGETSASDRQFASKDMRDTINQQEALIDKLQKRIEAMEERDRTRQLGEIELRADMAQIKGFADMIEREKKALEARVVAQDAKALAQDMEIERLRRENTTLKARVSELERLNGK